MRGSASGLGNAAAAAAAAASRLAWELATAQSGLVSAAASVRLRLNRWLDLHLSLDDARAKILAGAALVQIYTAFIYQGPRLVRQLARAL
jgi:hypothetical protein